MKLDKTKASFNTGTGILALGIVLCIAVAANVILSGINARWDMTDEKLYRLSDGTRAILDDVGEPVSLMLFFSRHSETPPELSMWARRVEDLLDEYQRAARPMISVSTLDPRPDSEIEDMAQAYGLPGQPMGHSRLYMGLVVSSGDRRETIPFLDPRAESTLEYNITRLIARAVAPAKPVIGVISSLPVLGDSHPSIPTMPPPAPAWFAFRELRKDYEVREIEASDTVIDPDVDALILVHPKTLSEGMLYAIDQFLLRGGSLLVFVDPLSLVEAETSQAPPMMRMQQDHSSSLPRLFGAWGVTFNPALVVADLDAASRMPGPNGIEENLVWLSLRAAHMNPEDILTSQISLVVMPLAGAFEVEPSADVTVTPLMTTSASSALINAMTAQFGGDGVRRAFVSGKQALTLAVRLQGEFKTAFPDGPPLPGGEAIPDDRHALGAALKESVTPGSVILVGNVDMLYDLVSVREVHAFGHRRYMPMNDNLALFSGMVEQLAGGPALSAVRARGRTDRPFTRVQEIERRAAERYLEEEMRLQGQWETAQTRLRELEEGQGDDQHVILSRQQQEEVARFREQVAETQRQLRLVRRKRNEDIEHLGFWIKAINIALMPALVSLGGVIFWVVRRRRFRR